MPRASERRRSRSGFRQQPAGRAQVPAALVALAVWALVALGGLGVAAVALVRAATMTAGDVATLISCTAPESVIIVEDRSSRAGELDPLDRRAEAIARVAELLAGDNCTESDLLTIVSFADVVVTTGPGPAGTIRTIAVAEGDGSDVALALSKAISLAAEQPDHRKIIVLLADVGTGSDADVVIAVEVLLGLEIMVVPIVSEPAADEKTDEPDSARIVDDIVAIVNRSRALA